MKISKFRKLNKYEYWFAAGKTKGFSFLPQLIICYDSYREKWYHHFSIETGIFCWNVGVFFEKIKSCENRL